MHRRGDQLLDALEGLLEHGGDVAAAAKALHLHRATLYRRIQRIEAITGLDFHRGEDRLSAHLAPPPPAALQRHPPARPPLTATAVA